MDTTIITMQGLLKRMHTKCAVLQFVSNETNESG